MLHSFVATLDLQERLDVRKAFFGGHTNATKLHASSTPGEKLRYYDFTSLYPYVNKYSKYPIGHPEILVGGELDTSLDNYFGVAKVKILAPKGLYHPVLPVLFNGKLTFPLCAKCAEYQNTDPCACTDAERCLIGTWCTPEIQMAKTKGYTIIKVYEVYHWAQTRQYNPKTKKGGLFTEYVNTFLKIKQESSGWPRENMTSTEKDTYVQDYASHEGIHLEHTKIKKNPGLRILSKLMLNSFWGKFGQKEDKTRQVLLTDIGSFYRMLFDETKEVTNFHIMNPSVIMMEYKEKDAFRLNSTVGNIFVAVFTTSWARLKLYGILDVVGSNCCYYDTDSIIYRELDDTPLLRTDVFLGDLTDELDEGDYIEEFVSTGPKSYAFRTHKGKATCKVKGFTLNYTNSLTINFESMKSIAIGDTTDLKAYYPHQIKRNKLKMELTSVYMDKKFKKVYTKRVVQVDLDTLPYGY